MLRCVDDLMPIGEFSDLSGLSPKRLRSYAAAGLLVPAAVDTDSGYRYYAPGQAREAQVIDALRRAEISLADIGALLRDPRSERLDAWARQVELEKVERHEAVRRARLLLDVGADRAGPGTYEARKERSMNLKATARTDIGRVRESNQDRAVSLERLAIVADGMGGHQGGETASALAATIVEAAFTGRSLDELEAATRAANAAVFERAAADEQLEGMGTTLCAVDVTEDEARHHPHRSVLTRAVGVGPTVDIDSAIQQVVPGDRLLLCSDGLFNEVREEQMLSLVESHPDLGAAAGALVDLAVANGGNDNVTVIVADVCA
jgi:protein phosphatase